MDFQTPLDLCRYIMSSVKIDKNDIVLEPTKGTGNFIRIFKELNLRYDTPEGDFFKYKTTKKYDFIIGNPPFTPMPLGYKILDICFDNLLKEDGELLFIMPILWLVNSTKRMKKYYPHLKRIHLLDRTVFKGSRVQCAVFHLTEKTTNNPAEIYLYNYTNRKALISSDKELLEKIKEKRLDSFVMEGCS